MEHHQAAEIENGLEKDEIVSASPDSGINLPYDDEKMSENNSTNSITDSEKPGSSEKKIQCSQSLVHNTLYPFYFKYPDNRKLALLKSLSQDSEYSLDTSLFDAEDFLQEMGFAGSTDPIIPDRFLPSLLQRLSKFPESEIVSLNHRVVQSIGCFKRKEGKRRLFRNLSMGKDSANDQTDNGNLPCPNSYPLLRSNTGPASFSFDDPSTMSRSTENTRYSKLMLDTSNNSSFAEDELLPESPIAILVSSASVDADQEEKVSPSIFQSKYCSEDDTSNCIEKQTLLNSVDNPNEEYENTEREIDDSLTKEILNFDISFEKADDVNYSESKKENTKNLKLDSVEIRENLIEFGNSESQTEASPSENFNSLTESTESPNDDVKINVFKQPLRRLSHSSLNWNSIDFSSSVHHNQINHFVTQNSYCDADNIEKKFESPNEIDPLQGFTVGETSIEHSELPDCASVKEDLEFTGEIFKKKTVSEKNCDNKKSMESFGCVEFPDKKNSLLRDKPKYTRDDSLTNFLSSMLDTNDDSLSSISPTTSQSFDFNSISEYNQIPDEEKITFNSSSQNDDNVQKIPEISFSNISQKNTKKDSKFTNSSNKEKIPNRKRRMLRRMSSSFHYEDDEIPTRTFDNEAPQNYSVNYLPPTNSVNYSQPKTPHQNSISIPHTLSCPIMYPCCCVPAVNMCRYHGFFNENFNKNCQNLPCSSYCDLHERPESKNTQIFTGHRKFKRNHKQGRYLSCPESLRNINYSACCHTHSLSHSIQNLHTSSQNLFSFPSPMCCNPQRCSGHSSGIDAATNLRYHGGYSSEPHKPSNIFNKHNEHHSSTFFHQQRDLRPAFKCRNSNSGRTLRNSTPDVRYESFCNHKVPENQNSCETNSILNSTPISHFLPKSKDDYSSDDVFLSKSETPFIPIRKEKSSCSKSKQCDNFNPLQKNIATKYSSSNFSPSIAIKDHSMISNKRESIKDGLQLSSQFLEGGESCKRYLPLKASNSYPLHQRNFSEVEEPHLQKRRSSCDENSIHDQNIKREAFLEKKIRVFSKFLTNLGDLSKSETDIKHNTDQKIANHSKKDNTATPDKKSEFYLYSDQNKLSVSDRCQTSSPELGKLLKLINSIDFNKNPKSFRQKSNSSENEDKLRKFSQSVVPVYENSVSLEMKDSDQGCHNQFTPVSYTSSISLNINEDNEVPTIRLDKEANHKSTSAENRGKLERTFSFHNYSIQMPFKEVSKELKELQLSIQKAKEMRISASKELHLLQELLSKNYYENHEHEGTESSFSNLQLPSEVENPINEPEKISFEALADLQKKSSNSEADDSSLWQEEMKKMKDENDAAWQIKLERMEKILAAQEEELRLMQSTNDSLQKQLELQSTLSHTCLCKGETHQNGVGRIDSAFEDDEEYQTHKSSISECERLQDQLQEAEQRADQLNLLLNQKLIELNKVQLALSKQTKEMVELEKSYLQLQYRLRKGTSKPMVAKLCSRTSPFNSKNLCPKPSPPASPHPNGIS